MQDSSVERARTRLLPLTDRMEACVLWEAIVPLVPPPPNHVIQDTMYHLRALSLSLTVYHVSRVNTVPEVKDLQLQVRILSKH